MEPRPSTSGSCRSGGVPEVAQQATMNPTPGPSTPRPCLTNPVEVPPHFLVPPEQLLPHQVRSGIDIGNLFKLLNALQNRIALACSQHQYLRDPLHHVRPPDTGAYKPLTTEAAVKDIRSLYRQQRNLMEKLRRWNCTNEGNCYDLIEKNTYAGICANCEQFAASKERMGNVAKALKKQKARLRRRALKKMKAAAAAEAAAAAAAAEAASKQQKRSGSQAKGSPASELSALPPPPIPRKRRKKTNVDCEPPHPESFLTQENFLSELGLVTPEVYQRTQAESRRTERRRRTTANPKYKSGTSADTNESDRSKRSRRSDPSSLPEPAACSLPSRTGAERRKARQRRYECTVCEKGDVDIKCNNCLSGFHGDCIKVSASQAPPPATVSVCPNCVVCNSRISASDCILLSRRISRPSIMGLKTNSELAAATNQTSPRYQKLAAARRKAAAAKKSSQKRKTPSPAKQRKVTVKQIIVEACTTKKPKNVPNTSKGKAAATSTSARRTLNHLSAVAAAAAVPAYCSLGREPEVSATVVKVEPVKPAPVKKVVPPVGIKWNKNHSKLRASKHRRPCLKTPIAPLPPPKAHFETVTVKKVVPVKATVTSIASAKPAPKPKKTTVLADSQLKNTPPPQTIIPAAKKQPAKKSEVKVVKTQLITKPKKSESPTATATSQGEPAEKKKAAAKRSPNNAPKYKKLNGAKPGAVDPFCMKRTMMAMSAAAGIVMMTNGIKLPAVSDSNGPTIPTPALSPIKSDVKSLIPSISPSTTIRPVPGPSGIKSSCKIESKVKEELKTPTPSPPVKKKPPKPKSVSPKKPIPQMDPAVEQSISDTISRVIFESAHGLYMDKKENLLQKVNRNIMDNELHRQRGAAGFPERKLNPHRTAYSPPPPSTGYLENMKIRRDELRATIAKAMGTDKIEDLESDEEQCESAASISSTIGSPRSLREVESDDSFELLSIPETPMYK